MKDPLHIHSVLEIHQINISNEYMSEFVLLPY